MFYSDDGFDDIYGHPELLPHKLKGLREIRCDQCDHEMQVLEQFEDASVPCAQCGQAIVLHGLGLEIPEDTSELKADLPTPVFSYEGLKQRRKARRRLYLRSLVFPAVLVVVYIALRIIERL